MVVFSKSTLTSRIKLAGGLGLVGVMGASVPATLAFVDKNMDGSLYESINGIAKQAYTSFSEPFQKMKGNFESEYSNTFGKVTGDIQGAPDSLNNKYHSGTQTAKGYYKIAEKYAEEVNYNLFEFWHFIKEVASYLPEMIGDSIFEASQGDDDDSRFLSFQKIASIATNPGMSDAFSKIAEVSIKHQSKLAEINHNDSKGLMEIIKDLKNDEKEIEKWLKKLGNNAEEVKNDTKENYCTATKLLTHLLIGKSTLNGVKGTVAKAKTMMTLLKSFKDKLNLNLSDDQITNFETSINSLEEQSKNETWIDPCPSQDQKGVQ